MPFFEMVDGRLSPAYSHCPADEILVERVLRAVSNQLLEIVDRPLLPVFWEENTALIPEVKADTLPSRTLVALDTQGNIVTLEVHRKFSAQTLVSSLMSAARNCGFSRAQLMSRYPGGALAFEKDWENFVQASTMRPAAKVRIVVLALEISADVRPALSTLAGLGIQAYDLFIDEHANRVRISVEEIRPRWESSSDQLLGQAANWQGIGAGGSQVFPGDEFVTTHDEATAAWTANDVESKLDATPLTTQTYNPKIADVDPQNFVTVSPYDAPVPRTGLETTEGSVIQSERDENSRQENMLAADKADKNARSFRSRRARREELRQGFDESPKPAADLTGEELYRKALAASWQTDKGETFKTESAVGSTFKDSTATRGSFFSSESDNRACTDRVGGLKQQENAREKNLPTLKSASENSLLDEGNTFRLSPAQVAAKLRQIAARYGSPVTLTWVQRRSNLNERALLTAWGTLVTADGAAWSDPSLAAQACSGRAVVDGWSVWKLPDGRSLAEAL